MTILKKVIYKLKKRRDLSLLRASGFFDKDWYLKNNQDVAEVKADPLLHYYDYGGLERRDPGPNFSSGWYMDTYPDVQAAGINPLVHYLKYGRREKREIFPDQQIGLRPRGLSYFLQTKYDIGRGYDPLSSFADLLMRHFYARLYQKESFDLRKQICMQYRGASILFHLRRAIRKLKLGQIPIRIVFLAQDSLAWLYMDTLYRACASDSFFQTYVINIGFFWGVQEECSAYLAKNNIQYLDGHNDQFRLDLLNPDIIVTSSPYDDFRPYPFRIANLLRYAKLVYITYGITFSDGAGNYNKPVFGLDTQKNAWRIFTCSKNTVGSFRKYGGVPSCRVVSLGLPIIDQYYSSSSSGVLPEAVRSASAGKFKIIYTPHHTVDGWSTFLRYGEHIRNLVQENEDCFLVFRPHWKLLETLKDLNLMSEDAFRRFFAGDRCYLYEGTDYNEFFRWSDVLISDASSFLGQYAPTRNPIIYLHREDGWGLDDMIREDIFKSCYVARSRDEITALFQQLKNGMDPLKNTRERYQENISVGMFTGGAGKRIAAYLRDKLA